MREYLKYNLNSYLHKDEKKYRYIWIFPLCLLFTLIYITYNQYAYNVYETNAQVLCETECVLSFYYQVTEGFYYDSIKINNQTYEIEEVSFGNVMLDNLNIPHQNIALKVKEYKGKTNEFVKLQIYKNKENFIKKIYKIMKER